FTLMKSVSMPELKNFISIFGKDQGDNADETGLQGKRLLSMKLARWSKLKEKLEQEKDESDARIDRKKYALTVYGRGIFFIRKYMESLAVGKPLNTSR